MTLETILSGCLVTVGIVSWPVAAAAAGKSRRQMAVGAATLTLGLMAAVILLAGAPVRADGPSGAAAKGQPDQAAVRLASEDQSAPTPPAETSRPKPTRGELLDEVDRVRSRPEIRLRQDAQLARPVDTANRPDWVTAEPQRDGPQFEMRLQSEVHASPEKCRASLQKKIRARVAQFVDGYLGNDRAHYLVRFDDSFIEQHVIPEGSDGRYLEELYSPRFKTSYYTEYARLKFDQSFRKELQQRWDKVVRTGRLMTMGLGAFGVLGLLGIAFGYLRLDTATKGYYSGRLQFLAAVAILALVAAGFLFVNVNADWLTWM